MGRYAPFCIQIWQSEHRGHYEIDTLVNYLTIQAQIHIETHLYVSLNIVDLFLNYGIKKINQL